MNCTWNSHVIKKMSGLSMFMFQTNSLRLNIFIDMCEWHYKAKHKNLYGKLIQARAFNLRVLKTPSTTSDRSFSGMRIAQSCCSKVIIIQSQKNVRWSNIPMGPRHQKMYEVCQDIQTVVSVKVKFSIPWPFEAHLHPKHWNRPYSTDKGCCSTIPFVGIPTHSNITSVYWKDWTRQWLESRGSYILQDVYWSNHWAQRTMVCDGYWDWFIPVFVTFRNYYMWFSCLTW